MEMNSKICLVFSKLKLENLSKEFFAAMIFSLVFYDNFPSFSSNDFAVFFVFNNERIKQTIVFIY